MQLVCHVHYRPDDVSRWVRLAQLLLSQFADTHQPQVTHCCQVTVSSSDVSVHSVCNNTVLSSVHLSAYLPAYPSVRPSICLSVCLSVRLPACLSVCPSICPYGCLFAFLPACLSVCLPVCPSVHPSVCLLVRLSVCLSFLSSYASVNQTIEYHSRKTQNAQNTKIRGSQVVC